MSSALTDGFLFAPVVCHPKEAKDGSLLCTRSIVLNHGSQLAFCWLAPIIPPLYCGGSCQDFGLAASGFRYWIRNRGMHSTVETASLTKLWRGAESRELIFASCQPATAESIALLPRKGPSRNIETLADLPRQRNVLSSPLLHSLSIHLVAMTEVGA